MASPEINECPVTVVELRSMHRVLLRRRSIGYEWNSLRAFEL